MISNTTQTNRIKSPRYTLCFLVVFMVVFSACSDHDHSSEDAHDDSHTANNSHADDTQADAQEHGEEHDQEHHESHEDDTSNATHRSADSHTHGDASLAIVLEGQTITVELDSPLFNLVGFEHAPETETQKQTVADAESRLGRSSSVVEFNTEANCSPKQPVISVHIGAAEHDDEHQDEDHENEHSDVILSYEFNCNNPDALTTATVMLFEHFKDMAEVDVVYLGPATQKQQTLSETDNRAVLTR